MGEVIETTAQRVVRLKAAFARDGFEVSDDDLFTLQSGDDVRIGMIAKSKTLYNYETKEPKITYYVEGTSYEMGYLLGLMAEPKVSVMTTEFIEQLPFAFVGLDLKDGPIETILSKLILSIADHWSQNIPDALPDSIKEQLKGVLEGCQKANADTQVTEKGLWLLNTAFDTILSHVFTGELFMENSISPSQLRIPTFCNAFSISGEAADGKHFFGRDFMFASADIFQNYACMLISVPKGEDAGVPFMSFMAPGMVGCITGLNTEGVAMGVNTLASAACNTEQPGFCSLLLVRYAMEHGKTSQEVLDILTQATRGVSWSYPVADGKDGSAFIAEIIESIDEDVSSFSDLALSYPSRYYRKTLPKKPELMAGVAGYQNGIHDITPYILKGVFPRWNDQNTHSLYERHNEDLWQRYNNRPFSDHHAKIVPGAFDPMGRINPTDQDRNCPSSFYFAPERQSRPDIVLATNLFIGDEMRYFAMSPWIAMLSNGKDINDFQWRYDELNFLIDRALGMPGDGPITPISEDTARELINFLSPNGRFPDYYDNSPKSSDGKRTVIEGGVSLLELKEKTFESQFGYYGDGWVKLHLMNYVS